MKKTLPSAVFVVLALTFGSIVTVAHAQGTAFTYNGRLNVSGAPAGGSYDLRFALCDAVTNGNVIAALTNTATGVSNGLFAVTLDFGGVFTGTNYWLELAARTNGGGAFSTLSPRQPITPTPYAIYSANAGSAVTANSANSVSAANITGTVSLTQLPGVVITNGGTFTGNGSGLTNLTGYVAKAGDTMSGTLNLPANGLVAGSNQLVLVGSRVGVATASPATTLDVNGTSTFRGTVNLSGPQVIQNATDGLWLRAPLMHLNDAGVGAGGNIDMVVGGGNVGIGTANPAAPLHVSSANSIAAIFDRTGGAGATIKLNNGTTNYALMSYLFGANSLELGPYGQTSMLHLDSSGNVGIGTTTPSAGLHVQNSGGHLALFQTTQTGAGIRDLGFVNSAGSVRVGIGFDPSLDALQIYDTTGINTTFKNGNVGIGVANPGDKLDVNGSVQIYGVNGSASLYVNADNVGRGIRLSTQDFNGTTGSMFSIGMGAGSGATFAQLQSYNGASYGNISINGGGGNVGIGTSTPFTPLQVHGADNATVMSIASSLALPGSWNGIDFGNDYTRKAGIFFQRTYNYYTGSLNFAVNNTLDGSEVGLSDTKMTITSTGNVGIGTASPYRKFQVRSGVDRILSLFEGGQASGVGIESVNDAGSANLMLEIRANPTVFTQGNVGIGTVTPQATLDVNGSVRASGTITAVGGLVIENRTSDPVTPATGQIWLRTDLP